MNQKIFAQSHCNLYYQRSLRQLFEIDWSICGKNSVYRIKSSKGFWEKVSGCVEHIETLTHIISNARLKQKGCIITLLDLKNAFNKVNHQLLTETLKLHHVPGDVITLLSSLYSDYDISILTDSFMTSRIRIHRGVVQGDSPN